MMQKKWARVSPQAFISNGDSEGNLSVSNALLFKVQQKVRLFSDTKPPLDVEIKRITSAQSIRVQRVGDQISNNQGFNISDFLLADNARISADEQDRPAIPPDSYNRAVYEEEPTVALRTIQVDELGNKYNLNNPFPVDLQPTSPIPVVLTDGSVNIGTVNAEIEMQLSSKDNDPDSGDVHDSVRIGDQNNEATVEKAVVGTKAGLNVNSLNETFSRPFNKLTVLTKNDDGKPLTIRSSYLGTPVQLMTLIWDVDGDFQDVEVVDI
jgi:hypothetical protein